MLSVLRVSVQVQSLMVMVVAQWLMSLWSPSNTDPPHDKFCHSVISQSGKICWSDSCQTPLVKLKLDQHYVTRVAVSNKLSLVNQKVFPCKK